MTTVDLLYEDPEISNQKFACISFVSPETILKKKELFYFEKFLNNWDLNKSTEKFSGFLAFLSYKYNITNELLMEDFKSFMEGEQEKLQNSDFSDDYKNFIDKHEKQLESQFNAENSFQTNIRGIKVRGCYSSQEEAEMRCKMLREIDPTHDVYVGPVGMWMPWHPDAYKTNNVEYLESELNDLMHEKNKNENKARNEFEHRVKTAKESAINENKKLAQDSGNKLTQNINQDGDLVSVGQPNNFVSVADIEKELFDSNEVRRKDDKEIKIQGQENN